MLYYLIERKNLSKNVQDQGLLNGTSPNSAESQKYTTFRRNDHLPSQRNPQFYRPSCVINNMQTFCHEKTILRTFLFCALPNSEPTISLGQSLFCRGQCFLPRRNLAPSRRRKSPMPSRNSVLKAVRLTYYCSGHRYCSFKPLNCP